MNASQKRAKYAERPSPCQRHVATQQNPTFHLQSFFHDPFLPPTVLICFDNVSRNGCSVNLCAQGSRQKQVWEQQQAAWQAVLLCSEGIVAFGAVIMVSALLYQSNTHVWRWERQSDVIPPRSCVFKSKHNKTSTDQKNRPVSRLSSVLTVSCRQLSQKLKTNTRLFSRLRRTGGLLLSCTLFLIQSI